MRNMVIAPELTGAVVRVRAWWERTEAAARRVQAAIDAGRLTQGEIDALNVTIEGDRARGHVFLDGLPR